MVSSATRENSTVFSPVRVPTVIKLRRLLPAAVTAVEINGEVDLIPVHPIGDLQFDRLRTDNGPSAGHPPQHRDQPSPPRRRHLDRTSLAPKRPRPVPIHTTPWTCLKRGISRPCEGPADRSASPLPASAATSFIFQPAAR